LHAEGEVTVQNCKDIVQVAGLARQQVVYLPDERREGCCSIVGVAGLGERRWSKAPAACQGNAQSDHRKPTHFGMILFGSRQSLTILHRQNKSTDNQNHRFH
jgi:hypothetical protein